VKKPVIRRAVWILLTITVMAAIFFFSSQNSSKSEDVSDWMAGVLRVEQTDKNVRASNRPLFLGLTLRKLAHVFLFFCLGFCMTQAMTGWRFRIPGAATACYLYAVTDELHQQWTGRCGRWEDTLIDLAGIVIGILLALLFARLREAAQKKRKSRKGEAGA